MLGKLCIFIGCFCCIMCIVAGRKVSTLEKAQKWTVTIEENGKKVCAGVLVDKNWVLTLPECIGRRRLDEYIITTDDGKSRRVTESLVSPLGNTKTLMLLRLQKKLELNSITPRLGNRHITRSSLSDNIESEIFHWSRKGDLKSSDVNIVRDGKCKAKNLRRGRQICYESMKTNTECSVIPGLPITAFVKKSWTLLGILTSEENVCDGVHRKAVEIAPYYMWIQTIIKDYNTCDKKPCMNGDCINILSGFHCTCNPGWTGRTCSKEISRCDPNPCLNGLCNDSTSSYTCDCYPGWTGCFCSEPEDINVCDTNPCINGTCNILENGFSCSCNAGWQGDLCADVSCGSDGECDSSNSEFCYTNTSSCECEPTKRSVAGNDTCLDSCSVFLPNVTSGYKSYYDVGGVLCTNTAFMSTVQVASPITEEGEKECLTFCTEDATCVFVSHLKGYGVCIKVSEDCPPESLYRKMTSEPTLAGGPPENDLTAVFVRQCKV